MVHLYVVGCGGVGKTTIINELVKQEPKKKVQPKRIYEVARKLLKDKGISGVELTSNQNLFWSFQSLVIQEQLRRESEIEARQKLFSDRCFLDAIIYGLTFFQDKFNQRVFNSLKSLKFMPNSPLKNDLKVEILSPFCNNDGVSIDTMLTALERYRRSLIVLVHPWGWNGKGKDALVNDGTRKSMTSNEVNEFTELYESVLRLFEVPFVALKSKELSHRVKLVQDLLSGVSENPFGRLALNEKLTHPKLDKKGQSEILEKEVKQFHQHFYLPKPSDQKSDKEVHKIQLPMITILPNIIKQSWTTLDPGKVNRIVDKYGVGDLFLIQFDISVEPVKVEFILQKGVKINGEIFSFLGCSSGGLKERKCYLIRGDNLHAEKIRNENGNFSKLKTVAKRIARFSLLLSNVKKTGIKIRDEQVLSEDDIERNELNFTDGCGGIALELARDVFKDVYRQEKEDLKKSSEFQLEKRMLKHLQTKVFDVGASTLHSCYNKTNCPSVLQIRFQGCKGVLALDKNLGSLFVRGSQTNWESDAEARADDAVKVLKIRPSMRKFETSSFPFICVCDYSKPYTFGHLNRQFIRLLSSLGVPDNVFLRKQEDHLKRVKNMTSNLEDALVVLQWQKKFHLAELLIWYRKQKELSSLAKDDNDDKDCSLNEVWTFIEKQLKDVQRRIVSQGRKDKVDAPNLKVPGATESVDNSKFGKKAEKLKLLIPESRTLFGICEPTQLGQKTFNLKYGECFVRVTVNGKPETIVGDVVVSKNPAYLQGDVRVLHAVSYPDLERHDLLVDCIVFPVVGPRPHSVEIAGSDLDGDEYFVCWDPHLIPPKIVEPYGYPAYEAPTSRQDLQTNALSEQERLQKDVQEMVKYFSIQNVAQKKVGRISSLFDKWADRKGAGSDECAQLGQLFARAVDSAKSGEKINIHENLELHDDEAVDERFVWQEMSSIGYHFSLENSKVMLGDLKDLSEEFLLGFISDRNSNLTEFEKFCLVMDYLFVKNDSTENAEKFAFEFFSKSLFAEAINFGLFRSYEKGRAISEFKFPIHFVMNSLPWKSRILTSEQMLTSFTEKFNFHNENAFPWELYFHWTSGENWQTEIKLQELVVRAVDGFSDVLIALQLPDDVCFVLRFQRNSNLRILQHQIGGKISIKDKLLSELGTEVSCYFYSGGFNYADRYQMTEAKLNFKVDFENNVLQLYRGSKQGTFLQFKMREQPVPSNRRSKIKGQKQDDDLGQMHSISVDLTSFPVINRSNTRHPLVRKVPVTAIETFVFNRKDKNFSSNCRPAVSYFDINEYRIEKSINEMKSETASFECFVDDMNVNYKEFEKILLESKLDSLFGSASPDDVRKVADVDNLFNFFETVSFELKTKSLCWRVEQKLQNILDKFKENFALDFTVLVKIIRIVSGLGFLELTNYVLGRIVEESQNKLNIGHIKSPVNHLWRFCSDWKLIACDFSLDASKVSMRLNTILDLNLIETSKRDAYVFRMIKREYASLGEEFSEKRKQLNFAINAKTGVIQNSVLKRDNSESIGSLKIQACRTTSNNSAANINDSREKTGAPNGSKNVEKNEVTFYKLDDMSLMWPRQWMGKYVMVQIDKSDRKIDKKNHQRPQHVWKKKGLKFCWSEHENDGEIESNSGGTGDFKNGFDMNNADYPSLSEASEIEKSGVAPPSRDERAVNQESCSEGIACLGRVTKFQRVPFYVTVEIVSPTDNFKTSTNKRPEKNLCCRIMQKCVEGDDIGVKWRLTLVQANVVTFSRVMDALKTLMCTKNENDLSKETAPVAEVTQENEETTENSENKTEKKFTKQFDDSLVPFIVCSDDQEAIKEKIPALKTSHLGVEGAFAKDLNESQKLAVKIARENRVSLIHGPPGTGKSTTACAIVRDVLANFDFQKVLVCAETNLAVDNLVLKFYETCHNEAQIEPEVQILRLKSREEKDSHRGLDAENIDLVTKFSLESKLVERSEEKITSRETNYLTNKQKKIVKEILDESVVVFTTCAGAGDPLLNNLKFDFVIIDEATLSREGTTLCALQHGCSHFVLIGDPNQLGPANQNADSKLKTAENLNEDENFSQELKQHDTFFHKFYAMPEVFTVAFLDTQHRMHPKLAAFPSKEFYDSKLKTPQGFENKRLLKLGEFLDQNPAQKISELSWWPSSEMNSKLKEPLCFVNVADGQENRQGTSWYNEREAIVLANIWVQLILSGTVKCYQKVGIITLYSGQVYKSREIFTKVIKNLRIDYPKADLEKFPKNLPEINSVDSFQGRENDVIIVSTVRTGLNLGFSGDRNRLNVLLTRAKKGLCVVGNQGALQNSEEWNKWLKEVCIIDSAQIK